MTTDGGATDVETEQRQAEAEELAQTFLELTARQSALLRQQKARLGQAERQEVNAELAKVGVGASSFGCLRSDAICCV